MRINEIFSHVKSCKVFADIGADHGYLAQMVANAGLAKRIYLTDISAPSLLKARKLLAAQIDDGLVHAVVCDGFKGISEHVDEAVIAGMGGEEMIKIISASDRAERLILQPMHNTDKLRVFLVGDGYKVIKDYTFRDGKYYDLITAERGEDSLTDDEIMFGRTNVRERPVAFLQKLAEEHANIESYLTGDMSGSSRERLNARKANIERFLYDNSRKSC